MTHSKLSRLSSSLQSMKASSAIQLLLVLMLLGYSACGLMGQSEQPPQDQTTGDQDVPSEEVIDEAKSQEPPDLIEPEIEGDQPETQAPAVEGQTASQPQEPSTTVELLWQVPGEAVEKYHLHYGFEETKLDHHLEIPVAGLERKHDAVHGPLFRFEIPNVPLNQTVFFSIQAENQYGLSPSSPVQSVAPEAKPAATAAKPN